MFRFPALQRCRTSCHHSTAFLCVLPNLMRYQMRSNLGLRICVHGILIRKLLFQTVNILIC